MSLEDLWQQAAAQVQAGQPHLAVQTVEQLLALDPDSVDAAICLAWLQRSLGQRQAAWRITQDLLKAENPGQPRAPSVQAQVWHLLGILTLDDGNPLGADQAFAAAVRTDPTYLAASYSWVELQRQTGNLDETMRLLDQALCIQPSPQSLGEHLQQDQQLTRLTALRSKVLVEMQAGHEREAQEICEILLASPNTRDEGLALAVWLVQAGLPSAEQLLVAAVAAAGTDAGTGAFAKALRKSLDENIHTQGYSALQNLSKAAARWVPDDSCFQCASLYAGALADDAEPHALLSQAKAWFVQLQAEQMAKGIKPDPLFNHVPNHVPNTQTRTTQKRKPKLAYFVRFPTHVPLVDAVIAAHDPSTVELHVFAPQAWPGLPAHVQLHDIDATQLGGICRAAGIDMLIETGGVQHYSGQYGVMQALASRVAPVQVGWMGTLMSSGGLFDMLLADDVSVAPNEEAHFSERVVRLQGGQWCWSPPELAQAVAQLVAPPVAPAPCLSKGHVTLGVVGRSLRHGPEFLNTLARVMAQDTSLEVRFVGQVWGDKIQKRALDLALESYGVANDRLHFDPPTSREGFWQWLHGVDMVLDTCPASGGLSLLDTLWMGVPVLTYPGRVLGSRQAASILTSLGLSQWVAKDADDLVRLTLATAGDCAALQASRMAMREKFGQSPLLDGRRIARQIEALALQKRDACDETTTAKNKKINF